MKTTRFILSSTAAFALLTSGPRAFGSSNCGGSIHSLCCNPSGASTADAEKYVATRIARQIDSASAWLLTTPVPVNESKSIPDATHVEEDSPISIGSSNRGQDNSHYRRGSDLLHSDLIKGDQVALFTFRPDRKSNEDQSRFDYALGSFFSSIQGEKSGQPILSSQPPKGWIGAPYLSPVEPAPGLRLFNWSF